MPESAQDIFSPRESRPLPQYGFGPNFTFDDLVQSNPFLCRVYTPRPHSPFFDDTEPFFIARKYNERYTLSSESLRESVFSPSTGNYSDVAQHMDWTTRSSSPFISTSFSFSWAIWEAARRYRTNVKHDIAIAVIDARSLEGRAVTALELLRKSTPKERHPDYWKWYTFALESQDVLVHGSIPGTAVFTSIPLLSILDKLPSYFLNPDSTAKSSVPFDRLAWDSTERKPSYREFCQVMSERFLRMPPELRLRDTTGGSVRLAVEFLRPWFHKAALEDFTLATSTVCELAFVIAQWPGQWWAHDHAEMWDVIRSMVQTVGEEMREKQKVEVLSEVKRLQGIVYDLERLVQDHETRASSRASLRKEEKRLSIAPASPATLVETPLPVAELPESAPPPPAEEPVRPHSMVETASCVVTGFLFGAFITLCIMSSQRRTLLTHLT